MKLLAALLVITGAYLYLLLHTTDVVLNQTQHLQANYHFVEQNADRLAAGK